MPRKRLPLPRVLEPKAERGGWRVVSFRTDGRRRSRLFVREGDAWLYYRRQASRLPGATTVASALAGYEEYLTEKGNRRRSIATTLARLRGWFGDAKQAVATITHAQIAGDYDRRRGEVAVDTSRNELAEVRTWFRWLVTRGWMHEDLTKHVKSSGRRRKGKPQLRESEARLLCGLATSAALMGEEAAVAVLMALLLGLRAGEILERVARDVDVTPGRVVLWIPVSKTAAGKRRLVVPEPLAGILAARVRRKLDWLFPADSASGHREKTWLRRNMAALCHDAGVPVVCPHGARGTQATLAELAGVAAEAVARQLGHTSHKVTEAHYLAPGTVQQGRVQRVTAALVK